MQMYICVQIWHDTCNIYKVYHSLLTKSTKTPSRLKIDIVKIISFDYISEEFVYQKFVLPQDTQETG